MGLGSKKNFSTSNASEKRFRTNFEKLVQGGGGVIRKIGTQKAFRIFLFRIIPTLLYEVFPTIV